MIQESLPTLAQISDLPQWAILAFATRCVRRALRFIDRDIQGNRVRTLADVADFIESVPERTSPFFGTINVSPGRKTISLDELPDQKAVWDAIWGSVSETEKVADKAANIARDTTDSVCSLAAWTAAFAGRTAHYAARESADEPLAKYHTAEWAVKCTEAAIAKAKARLKDSAKIDDFAASIGSDLEIIQRNAKRDRWTDKTIVPAIVFYLNTVFDWPENAPLIIHVSSVINAKLLAHFCEHPERLYHMSPKQFEELIAEIVHRFGYEVELTQRTRDGGFDIIALDDRNRKAKYLIECKRYKPTKPITVGLVRQLGGAILDYVGEERIITKAPKGIFVTTSYFTGPARDYLERNSWLLSGTDFDGLVEWLKVYDEFKMSCRGL
jgi:HJR/Mrr/RecB family endonuclease